MISRKNQVFDFILAIPLTILIFTLPDKMIISVITFIWVDSCLIGKAIYRLTWDELWYEFDVWLGFEKEVN